MNVLTLTITNLREMPDGGPLSYVSHGRSFEIGRDMFRDWVLPDPDLFISGRHVEIQFDGEGYILNDVSRNGTFVNGSGQRVKSPYRIFPGDKIEVGNYVIVADIRPSAQAQELARPGVDGTFGEDDDIWGVGTAAPPPMDRRQFEPPRKNAYAAPDFRDSYLDMPALGAGNPRPQPQQQSFGAFPAPPLPQPSPPPYGEPPQVPSPLQFPANPFASEQSGPRPSPGGTPWRNEPAPQPAPAFQFEPQPATAGRRGESFIEAFQRGARLTPGTLQGRDPGELGQEIGEILLMASELIMTLLAARASAKSMTRSSNRTMIGPLDNNPLKFTPGAPEALDIMIGRNRQGYLDGRRAFQEASDDLKAHEMATYTAMQKALFRLLEDDLSPEAIEKKVSVLPFANRKAKAWEIYTSSWKAKRAHHENGMLDVFLGYFGEAYKEAVSKKR
jgi:type VI secretion system protein ImpI